LNDMELRELKMFTGIVTQSLIKGFYNQFIFIF
jgi:hypothetical protein